MPKRPNTFDQVCSDIYSFIELFVFNRLKHKYKNYATYANRSRLQNHKHTDIPNLLHIDPSIVRALSCYANGKRYKMTDIWTALDQKLIHHFKTNKTFKSGKSFHLPSYYELPDSTLKALFDNPPRPRLLSPRARRVWNRFIESLQNKPVARIHSRTSQPSSTQTNKHINSTLPSTSEPIGSANHTSAANDIPPDSIDTYTLVPTKPSHVGRDSGPYTSDAYVARLRALVERKAMGRITAAKYAKAVGIDVEFKEPRTGFCAEDNDWQAHKDFWNYFIEYKKANNIQQFEPKSLEWLRERHRLILLRLKEEAQASPS